MLGPLLGLTFRLDHTMQACSSMVSGIKKDVLQL